MEDILSVRRAIAPSGTLRTAINRNNMVLAKIDPTSGEPAGISVDLASTLARKLSTAVEFIPFDSARKSVDAVANGVADIGFFAVDQVRGGQVAFTAPYALIEGCYLVRQNSPILSNAQVDQAPNRVVVGAGSAYDLFLTRGLKHAQLVRVASSSVVLAAFLEKNLDVAAGVRQRLEAGAALHPGLRLITPRFMEIRQAIGVAKARGNVALEFLKCFVEDAKATGFVAQSMTCHGVEGVSVAPASDAIAES